MALLHGLHAQVFPRLNLPCFSDVLWRATVGRCARKSAACAELWGLIFLCRVKVHTVRVFQWPSWRALASQNLLGSGFLSRHTGRSGPLGLKSLKREGRSAEIPKSCPGSF